MISVLADSGLPQISHWMVWGPLGVLLGFGLVIFWDYYRSEIKPRAKQRRENDHSSHLAHLDFVKVTKETLGQQTVILTGIQETHRQHGETLREHTEDLSWIKKHIRRDSDPDQSAIDD